MTAPSKLGHPIGNIRSIETAAKMTQPNELTNRLRMRPEPTSTDGLLPCNAKKHARATCEGPGPSHTSPSHPGRLSQPSSGSDQQSVHLPKHLLQRASKYCNLSTSPQV
eukprot:8224760-Pyramimonas_sp.AAC.1